MTNFNKTDIKTLDFLVDETLKNEIVTADNLKGLYPPADLLAEFKRLIYIINEYEICDCNFEEDSEFIRKNAKTLNFKTDGGFKKIYADLKEKEERESIEFEKTKIEFELSKKILKEYPKTKFIARLGAFISILLVLKEIIEWIMTLSL